MKNTNPLYEDAGLLRRESPNWEEKLYQFKPSGMGDCISNTAEEGMRLKEPKYLVPIFDLLQDNVRIRWPNAYNIGNEKFIAKTRWAWEVSKHKRFWLRLNRLRKDSTDWGMVRSQVWNATKSGDSWRTVWRVFLTSIEWRRLEEADRVLFRPQRGVTRDSYTYAYSYAIMSGFHQFKDTVDSPWWLGTSPTYNAWVRYIKTGRGEKTYLRREYRSDSKLEYVQRMKAIRLQSALRAKLTIWNKPN